MYANTHTHARARVFVCMLVQCQLHRLRSHHSSSLDTMCVYACVAAPLKWAWTWTQRRRTQPMHHRQALYRVCTALWSGGCRTPTHCSQLRPARSKKVSGSVHRQLCVVVKNTKLSPVMLRACCAVSAEALSNASACREELRQQFSALLAGDQLAAEYLLLHLVSTV